MNSSLQQAASSTPICKPTAVEHLLAEIAAQGTDVIFGVPGGHIATLTQTLRRQDRIRYFIAVHEAGAAFMADGYARATGRLGVCAVTAGPGVTNALTGVVSAQLDQIPLLFISGQTATDRFGLSAIQESTSENGLNTVDMLRHCVASSSLIVDARAFPRLLSRAIRTATRLPYGVAHICLPANIAGQEVDPTLYALPPFHQQVHASISAIELETVARHFAKAKRPLIYLGSGARAAMEQLHDEVGRFITKHNIPVVTSVRAKGVLSEGHPMSLGVFGISGSDRADRYVASGVDVMLVIGSKLGEWSSKGFSNNLKAAQTIIQVDIDSRNIGQLVSPTQAIIADANAFLRGLVSSHVVRQADNRLTYLQQHFPTMTAIDGTGANHDQGNPILKARQVMAEINCFLPKETDIYVDIGNCTAWATHCLSINTPTRIFLPCGLSSMGWSCGAVIGGKIGCPERNAIALIGDGAFLMNGTEISTAAKYGIGTITIVLQDNYLGTVNHGELAAGEPYSIDDSFYALGKINIEKLAESLGACAYSAYNIGDVTECLKAAFSAANSQRRPQVIVAHVDHRECPPFGDRFQSVAAAARAC